SLARNVVTSPPRRAASASMSLASVPITIAMSASGFDQTSCIMNVPAGKLLSKETVRELLPLGVSKFLHGAPAPEVVVLMHVGTRGSLAVKGLSPSGPSFSATIHRP